MALNPSLYFHTLRHLKSGQVSSRLLRRINGRAVKLSAPAAVAARPLASVTPWPVKTTGRKSLFNFLNLTREFLGGRIDWRSVEMPKLWRYNLHYFDYLLDPGRPIEDRCRMIDDWIGHNRVGAPDAWEPFPVSLRIVNWIKFFLSEGRGQFKPERLQSLYSQTLWLEGNIENHLLANHLFKNAKALLFAGLFFEGRDAGRWRGKALELLNQELPEQVLADGGHFERSPMYHSMILEDCLDLLNLCNGSSLHEARVLDQKLPDVCQRMTAFLLGMSHPDRQIALFNDAAFGIEAQPEDLARYYGRVAGAAAEYPKGCTWQFPDTGYFVMAPRAEDRLIVDCGAIGPDYQPGHSHCDTLSFELSLGGRRVVVDSGCCQYEDGDIRQYNRGNTGHNTVTVDAQNQSEVWGAHRCARRARPVYARLQEAENGTIVFKGAHDGYRRLRGRPTHHRKITWAGDRIDIEDRIEGRGVHAIESRLHIHPDLKVEATDTGVRINDDGRPLMTVSASGPGRVAIESGWHCPEFNRKVGCPVLTLRLEKAPLPARLGWMILAYRGS